MSHNFNKCARPGFGPRRSGQTGVTILEIIVFLAIMGVIFLTIHFTLGNAISAKLTVSNRVVGQDQGRQTVEWIADRVRVAGFRADPASAIARCRNGIVSQDSQYYPTANALSVTGDVDNEGTAETRTFKIETVGGVPAVTETVTECVTGATTSDKPITDTTSAKVLSLTFAYYDANGTAVTNLTTPSSIQSIRDVGVTVQVRALAGRSGPTDQTWSTNVSLRNP
jgi:hypothetical protein